MAWVKLTDDFYDHPKFYEAGPLGLSLWTVGIAWCNRNLTDGFIPRAKARTLLDFDRLSIETGTVGELASFGQDVDSDYVIQILLDCGLWEPVNGGYIVHDYLDYQPSAAEVIALKNARTKAGKKGAAAKWSKEAG
jgi:hypothetical protein